MKRRRPPRVDMLLANTFERLVNQLAEQISMHVQPAESRRTSAVKRPGAKRKPISIPAGLSLKEAVDRFQMAHVMDAMERCGKIVYNLPVAAKRLGIGFSTLKAILAGGPRPAAPLREWDDSSAYIEPLTLAMEDFEERYISNALRFAKGNVSLAAKHLGIGRSTLKRKRDRMRRRLPLNLKRSGAR